MDSPYYKGIQNGIFPGVVLDVLRHNIVSLPYSLPQPCKAGAFLALSNTTKFSYRIVMYQVKMRVTTACEIRQHEENIILTDNAFTCYC